MSRFTVSVPSELLETFDRTLVQGEESRSAVVRRLLEDALRDAQEQEDVRRYIEGYRDTPQTEDELGWSDQVVQERLSELPWK
jgi:metal-responsive CopG/Arc/MetJ family transcriptional regulator